MGSSDRYLFKRRKPFL